MVRNPERQTTLSAILATAVALAALFAGCSSGMGHDQNTVAGNQKLRDGISAARTGIKQYQAGDTNGGSAEIQRGREMMGQGMSMMGLGCCLFDGGVILEDGGVMAGCASMMRTGATPMMQGLANFDAAHKTMMGSSDAVTIGRSMTDMETAMRMMEQGAGQMMSDRGRGSMGMM